MQSRKRKENEQLADQQAKFLASGKQEGKGSI